jgi:hypothetical protein
MNPSDPPTFDVMTRLDSLAPFFWIAGEGDEPPGKPERVVGHDRATHLVIAAGEVWSVDYAGVLPRRLVNRSVNQFVDSLAGFRAAWATRADLDEAALDRQVVHLREILRNIDPEAIGDPESWWSVILEQMAHGLL